MEKDRPDVQLRKNPAMSRRKDMAPHQIFYLKAVPMVQNPWVEDSKEATGFPTEREAQMEKSQYKDASGVEEKDGRFYVMKVVPS
jgi:hypothetical protein